MVCHDFILPEICKPCLFVFLRNLFYLIFLHCVPPFRCCGLTSDRNGGRRGAAPGLDFGPSWPEAAPWEKKNARTVWSRSDAWNYIIYIVLIYSTFIAKLSRRGSGGGSSLSKWEWYWRIKGPPITFLPLEGPQKRAFNYLPSPKKFGCLAVYLYTGRYTFSKYHYNRL